MGSHLVKRGTQAFQFLVKVNIFRYSQVRRFSTGVVLGMLLVVTFGVFAPLLARSPDSLMPRPLPESVLPAMASQSINSPALKQSSLETSPESSPEIEGSPEIPPPAILPVDTSTHWAADCIRELALRRAIPVDEQALFYPDQPATWAVLTEMFNLSFPTDGVYSGASALEAALDLPSAVNVLYSYPSNNYDPEHPVTRSQAFTALAAKTNLPFVPRANELLTTNLVDGGEIPDYGREGVASALAAHVLVNYPDSQRFEGNRAITRGEVAAMVCRTRPESVLRSAIAPEWIVRPPQLATQRQPDSELRGVWLTNIDSDVLFSRENLMEGIQRLKAMHVNTLYPVVWNFGYPQFPSTVAEQILGRKQRLWPGDNPAFEATQRDRDMLQEIIELAHAEGMAVIPWFEFGFMAPDEYVLLEQHPDWFTHRQDGSRELQLGAETFTWMNPLHPRTQQLLLLLMNEVLENYDVEGIQVDDHLGMPVDMGYDPVTLELYAQEHEGAAPPEDYTDPAWIRWRADKITAFMAQVRRLVDLRKPGAILSVSPNPYPFSYHKYLQDWPTWEAAGLVDELVIQVYRNDVDRFVWELNRGATVTASRNTPTSIGLLSGLRGRPTDAELLTKQLAAVRDRSYAGVSYFFYQTLWTPGRETLEERETKFRTSFAQPAPRPE